ncbi:MAG: VCBS repeat-containing protein [Labilithrix sp.]|nr:VCBS repeat-containing protein [Labilithrix sp.]MCW5814592.1 VCBS repeat-containing protein [Labilithrix sp.]
MNVRGRVVVVTLSCLLVAAALESGCGSSVGSNFDDGGGDDAGDGSTGASSTSGFTPGSSGDGGSSGSSGGECDVAGRACGDAGEGVCAGGLCCAAALACGATCCADGTVCSFQTCVTPGATCFDSSDCAANEYCELSLGTSSDAGVNDASCVGASDRSGKCLPRPPECVGDAGATADGTITCLQKCEVRPATPTFAPALKAAWGGETVSPFSTDVMMAPIVIQLDDDDCDGKVTERDIPEIVFSTFSNGAYRVDGRLHAISLRNGSFVEKWTVPNATNGTVVYPTKQIAAGNFDGLPGNEVVACGVDGKVHAFRGTDGSLLWSTTTETICFMPAIADLDGDGKPEVIVEGGILDGADGTLKHGFEVPLDGPFVVSDIDSDGRLDVVTYARAYSATGVLIVDTGMTTTPRNPDTGDWKGPWSAVADFDGDGKPEVVAVDNETHTVHMWRYDPNVTDGGPFGRFTIVRQPVDMNALFDASNQCPDGTWGATHGGGPPTIGDFDRDGVPDVALAGGIGYVVFDGRKLRDETFTGAQTILWSKVTTDCSSASTGSTLFDFDGDGKAEVVYSDELRLRIYEGATGNELASICNTTATLIEFPIVADVDNDGQADIVVVSNAYNKTCDETTDGGAPSLTRQAGVRVFGPSTGAWVRTRRVWNEHAYHVTNVNEDGTIAADEPKNWTQNGLNNFRQNKQPGSEFAAPNLVATISPVCEGDTTVTVVVRNVGEAAVPAGVVIGVYAGTTKLGSLTTTRPLYPAEAQPLDQAVAGAGVAPGATVRAIVDDGAPPHPSWTECRTDDNTAQTTARACSGVPK